MIILVVVMTNNNWPVYQLFCAPRACVRAFAHCMRSRPFVRTQKRSVTVSISTCAEEEEDKTHTHCQGDSLDLRRDVQ